MLNEKDRQTLRDKIFNRCDVYVILKAYMGKPEYNEIVELCADCIIELHDKELFDKKKI